MRKKLYAFGILISAIAGIAQTFNGTGGQIQDSGNNTPFQLNVNGLPGMLDNNFGLIEVCMDITHPDMNEITVSLRSPSGKVVELINSTSIKGSNFTSTCFNSQTALPLTSSSAPYSGTFKPTGYIGRFNNNEPANGNWTLLVKDYNFNGISGSLSSWSLRFGSNPPQAVNFTSSNLPIVFINTNGQALTTNSVLADFGIVDNGAARNNINDPKNNYNGKAQINIRGSSSQIFEKKSFKIDLVNENNTVPVKAPLMGMPAESDWILSPAYSDKTFMRNALAHYMFRNMAHYSPRSRFVEVVLNGEYWGIYTFIEKPKRAAERIDVMKIGPLDNNFPFITGGYILQINRTDNPGFYSEYAGNSPAGNKFYYQYEFPKPEDITIQQKQYIEAVMDTFETVMNGAGYSDPNNGYRKYINLDSFVDLWIVNEFSKNVDGYGLSTYLYKDNVLDGNKISLGPVWDYDIAFSNANYADGNNHQWWRYNSPGDHNPTPVWWMKLVQDPYFTSRLYCRWHTFRKGLLSTGNIHSWIDQQAALLAEAQARNFTQFPILDAYVFPNPSGQIAGSFQAVVNDLKNWITKRGEFMDQYVPGTCNTVSLSEFAESSERFIAFPNPFDNNITLRFSSSANNETTISVYNLLGELVSRSAHSGSAAGEQEVQLSLDGHPGGTYLVSLETGKTRLFQKIIKTEK